MVRLLARLRRSFALRPKPTRRRSARPDVELLEFQRSARPPASLPISSPAATPASPRWITSTSGHRRCAGALRRHHHGPSRHHVLAQVDGAANGYTSFLRHRRLQSSRCSRPAHFAAGSHHPVPRLAHASPVRRAHGQHRHGTIGRDPGGPQRMITLSTRRPDFDQPGTSTVPASPARPRNPVLRRARSRRRPRFAGDGTYRFVVDPVAARFARGVRHAHRPGRQRQHAVGRRSTSLPSSRAFAVDAAGRLIKPSTREPPSSSPRPSPAERPSPRPGRWCLRPTDGPST